MIKLYGKVFLGFWLVTLAVLASWTVVGKYLDVLPVTEEETWRDARLTPRLLHSLTYAIQNMPRRRLQHWIDRQQTERGITLLLMDKKGRELFGRALPLDIKDNASRLIRSKSGGRVISDDNIIVAQPVFREDAGALRLIALIPRPSSPVVQFLAQHIWVRLVMAMLMSALICYALSRLLTRPIHDLQVATRKLALGELDTRIPVPDRGGDETTELARDFNAMAAQLKSQIDEQKRLLHDVSHELRSPLARLRVAAALANESDNREQHLERMDHEIDRLDTLIDQLLATPTSTAALDDSLDLVSLLQQLIEDAQFEASNIETRIELSTTLKHAVVRTKGDLLLKAFENIIRNALHYSDKGSLINVKLVDAGAGGFQIDIEDEGPGVPDAELTRLFDAFYRVDRSRQRGTGGHGLGLSIAHRAITQHGGQIWASNTSRGLLISALLPDTYAPAGRTA